MWYLEQVHVALACRHLPWKVTESISYNSKLADIAYQYRAGTSRVYWVSRGTGVTCWCLPVCLPGHCMGAAWISGVRSEPLPDTLCLLCLLSGLSDHLYDQVSGYSLSWHLTVQNWHRYIYLYIFFLVFFICWMNRICPAYTCIYIEVT